MNITKRLFSYPVLADDKDDYNESIFDVSIEYTQEGVNTMCCTVNIEMDNEQIHSLLLSGDVEYVIHLECTTTAYRTTISTISPMEKFNISLGKLKGKLEIVVLIVAKKSISQFKNDDWNEDYAGMAFDFAKGAILGYKNLPSIDIVKDYEEFSCAGSLFSVYKRLTKEVEPMVINLDGGQIKLGLSSEDYNLYTKFCKRTQFQPILNAMFIFPALLYIFEELKQENGIEMYEGKTWFISFLNAYKKRGFDFIEEIQREDKTSVALAQEAMELPLHAGLISLAALFETGGEEEA